METEKSKPVYQMYQCVWEITLACCFSCKYCGSQGGKARENELSTAECLDLANQIADLGCKKVNLIGGEVFIRKDWDQIAKTLTDRGVAVYIITNGWLFTEELIARMKEVKITAVAISLDGPEDVHDKYRQSGSFQRAKAAIETLTQNGIPVSVISTLNHENSLRLDEMYDFLKQYPLYAWQLQGCTPMGNAAKMGVDYEFNHQSVIDFAATHLEESPFIIATADDIGYFSEMDGYLRGNLSGFGRFSGCAAGIKSIGIDSIGNIRGCESMYDDCFIEGNIREQSLADIWNDPDNFAYNRKFSLDKMTGYCAECEYNKYCGGGCRSHNYFTNDKKMYESKYCIQKKKD